MGEVVVAPPWCACHPLEVVVGEVRRHELVLLMNMIGVHRMHGGDERCSGLHRLPRSLATGPSWVDSGRSRRLAGVRHRLVRLPQRQRPESRVGGQEIDQVGGAGSWQADDDQRRLDPDVQDLRVVPEEVTDPEPVGRGANRITEHQHAAESRALDVRVHFVELDGEPLAEAVRSEVVQPDTAYCLFAHGVDGKRCGLRVAVLDPHSLHTTEDGRAEVVDVDITGHTGVAHNAR